MSELVFRLQRWWRKNHPKPEPEIPLWIYGMQSQWVRDDETGKIYLASDDCADKSGNIRKNENSFNCRNCGGPVKSGPSRCPYCGGDYKGAHQ